MVSRCRLLTRCRCQPVFADAAIFAIIFDADIFGSASSGRDIFTAADVFRFQLMPLPVRLIFARAYAAAGFFIFAGQLFAIMRFRILMFSPLFSPPPVAEYFQLESRGFSSFTPLAMPLSPFSHFSLMFRHIIFAELLKALILAAIIEAEAFQLLFAFFRVFSSPFRHASFPIFFIFLSGLSFFADYY
jgi:hypothetical protein